MGSSSCWQDIVALGRSLLLWLDVVLDGFEHDAVCEEWAVKDFIKWERFES